MFSHFGIVISIWLVAILVLLCCARGYYQYHRLIVLIKNYCGGSLPGDGGVNGDVNYVSRDEFTTFTNAARNANLKLIARADVLELQAHEGDPQDQRIALNESEIAAIKAIISNSDDPAPISNNSITGFADAGTVTRLIARVAATDAENIPPRVSELERLVRNLRTTLKITDGQGVDRSFDRLDLETASSHWSRRVERPHPSLAEQDAEHVENGNPERVASTKDRREVLLVKNKKD